MDHKERTVVVTGGGSGIGRAAAVRFARAGARVLITGRRSEVLEETAGPEFNISYMVADVRLEAEAANVIRTAANLYGSVDVLVNNAGAFARSQLADITPEIVGKLFGTNVFGPTWLAREALPYLKQSRGAIVNVSSTFGHKSSAMSAHYGASKAALEYLTRSWALELAPFGIRVNAVAPGPTETSILSQSGLSPEKIEEVKRNEAARIPLGRRGTPEEVAEWIVALADPTASWVTGQVLSLDGGLSAT